MRFDIPGKFAHYSDMHSIHFDESLESILKRERRYDPQAYFFLRDALDFTLRRVEEMRKAEGGGARNRHVSGRELLEGFRDCALEEFGPMAATLMEEWGVRRCEDVGNMVFQMIEEQVFGRQDSDSPEDFREIFDFDGAFRSPFLPVSRGLGDKKGRVRSRAEGQV